MGQQPTENNTAQGLWGLYRFIDKKQPEVKWTAVMSLLMECLFVALSLHSNFTIYESDICNIIQCIIAGLIGFIGVAIAGIAIVIALFTADQIKLIDDLKEGSFDQLLYDFKWFALVSAVEAVIFIATIFVIKSPYPIAPIWLFYILTFCLIYGVLYLLFYGCALIGNFIKMAKIKCVLDSALKAKKDISVVAIEVQLNFLVSKLLGGDKQASREFYNELIEIIEKSSMNNKDELIAYLKERYTAI